MSGPITWFSVIVTPGQYYVASIGYQLEQKGDVDGFYTNVFIYIFGGTALLAPLGGMMVGPTHASQLSSKW